MEQMKQTEFMKIIQSCRRRLNLAGFLDIVSFALCVGAAVGIFFQTMAFITPVYYANFYTGLALLFAVISAAAAAYVKRIHTKQAALTIDGFGFGERVITAYEHLGESGMMVELQREDAMRQLNAYKERIHIPMWRSWKKLALFAALMLILSGLIITPSSVKDRAAELHKIRETAREKEEEIKDTIDELKQLGQGELTPQQQASIQEMIESLQSSMSEYQQASSAEALNAAGDKLNYKYNDMSSRLSELAQSLQSGAEVSPVTERSMQAMAKKMQEMSGMQPSADGSLAYNPGQSGNGQNGDGGQGGSSQNGDGGQSGSSQNGDGGQGGSGQNGDGGQGGSGQNGDGGQGGNGQGDGSGTGNGRGTGSSNTPHDYVSVPNDIADDENLTGSSVDHDNSEFFRAPNGLSWEGEHTSHEAVIGSYKRNAYDGIAAGKYPSGMEDVIKEYFSSFN